MFDDRTAPALHPTPTHHRNAAPPPLLRWRREGEEYVGTLALGDGGIVRLRWQCRGEAAVLQLQQSVTVALPWSVLAEGLERLWLLQPQCRALQVDAFVQAQFAPPPPVAASGRLSRADFFQQPLLWYHGDNAGSHPLQWCRGADGLQHPQRRPLPPGLLYRRRIPSLGRELSFRRLDPARDLDRFTAWMNQPRVAQFWELAKPRAELLAYLQRVLADPHLQPVIGCFDDEPFGYFELYWALEDRLGPHYDARPFDRGMHVLVGEPRFLGRAYTLAWLNGLSHFLFLDDARTQRLVGEPRADNQRMLKYLALTRWRKRKEFDFPHKRAALVMCERADFFAETDFA